MKHPRTVAALLAFCILPCTIFAQAVRNTNQSRRQGSVIAGGWGNLISSNSTNAVIGGGRSNKAGDLCAVVGGGLMNTADDWFTTVAGGTENWASGNYATVGGGWRNVASGSRGTIAGGEQNKAEDYLGTVGGGFNNRAGNRAVVAGGSDNWALGSSAAVGGGYHNYVSPGNCATVAGGYTNWAAGNYATVPGGARCHAIHNGSFVWSGDDSETTSSTGGYTFTVRCEGGATFYTADGTDVGPRMGPGGTQWITTSDSNLKTKVTAVNTREILAKLSRLPVTQWEYKHNPNRRYIGPMAQDFHAMFGLGDDDKGIGTLDSDGVMYAAIQGLVEELKDRDKAMADRDRQIDELKAKSAKVDQLEKLNRELTRRIESIDQRLKSLPPQP